jgi:glycosyltransferase involved in cell wall biosynthesis
VRAPSRTTEPVHHKIVLLDLSGDEKASNSWAAGAFPGEEIYRVHKQDLKWASKIQALTFIRNLKPRRFAVFCADIQLQSSRVAITILGAVAGARAVVLGDLSGRTVNHSRYRILLLDGPGLALEAAAGYLVLIPFFWMSLLLLRWVGPVLKSTTHSIGSSEDLGGLDAESDRDTAPMSVLYLRAAPGAAGPAVAQSGGMATHVGGFASGARSLGHYLKFISSGEIRIDDNSAKVQIVPPSGRMNASRTLFELYNSLWFTFRALSIITADDQGFSDFDFIYQRYNRFNCAGVILSLVTGRPLLLEFNGSEVWVAKNWDPIGQLGLLRRIEDLNLRCADLIFVVSEADKRKLLAGRVDPDKVVVNPNGVDTDKFKPGCGGVAVRRELGLDDKLVIGFLGTFGPWHGTTVLAQAAALLADRVGYHFLFIGDGDYRPAAEAIIDSAGRARLATFLGRVSHEMVPSLLDGCNILISPHVETPDGSEFFGSPTKLFEYLAMAKPVVCSQLGQMATVIVDGSNGLLVPPGDSQKLACAIDRLARDSALRATLGAHAREAVVSHYTWRRNAGRVFDAFQNKIEGTVLSQGGELPSGEVR